MVKVLLSMEGYDEHVIYVDLHSVSQVVCEYLVDQPLVGCTCVLQTKGHDFVTEDSPFSDEGRLCLIVWVHKNLLVA